LHRNSLGILSAVTRLVRDGEVESGVLTAERELKSVEKLLSGARTDDKTLKAAGDAAVEEAEIIGDVRGSAAYKRELLRVYIGRAVRAAAGTSQ
jgi:carbon-monoxide dehydrogenase medium subunit